MARVIEREIIYNEYNQVEKTIDHPSTYEKAVVLSGRKLDRRKNYAIIHGEVMESAQWTAPCSGCHEGFFGDAGSGCHECGYTGKRINRMWVSLS